MSGARAVLLVMAVLVSTAACEVLSGPSLTCVQVDAAECRRQADAIVAQAKREEPTKRVVSIKITRNDGIEVTFDDGTGYAAIP